MPLGLELCDHIRRRREGLAGTAEVMRLIDEEEGAPGLAAQRRKLLEAVARAQVLLREEDEPEASVGHRFDHGLASVHSGQKLLHIEPAFVGEKSDLARLWQHLTRHAARQLGLGPAVRAHEGAYGEAEEEVGEDAVG